MVVLVKCDMGLLADKARGGNCQHYLLPSMHSRVWGGVRVGNLPTTVTCSKRDEKGLSCTPAISYSLYISLGDCACADNAGQTAR